MALRDIFIAALQRDDPDDRRAYLAAACGPDDALRARVDSLLAVHERADSFLESPPVAPAATVDLPTTEGPGAVIGPYKLLQQIGEGGMGVVFMAEQQEPVRRKVALKIIKPGMDSRQVVARFEAERQALSMMDHPHIARVFDAGTTGSGRPYFVMELVHGVPITEYCDAHKLPPADRAALFVSVCQAIQHAHQKGVIHRDIKPSNVLVTMYDDKPVPKVIDFGVAKAVESSLTASTLFTQYGALVGTLEYMSPEQAEMNALGVDTRSDVYALGVLLYELLTGSTPLDRRRLREAALGEVVRLIREVEPERPSTRLSTADALANVAAARGTQPVRLVEAVRGELDWITMRCLEKDRTRRYDSAGALARDVERHLAGDAVEACPPTLGYRLHKAYRKNRTAVLVSGLVAAAVVAGLIGTTAGLLRAEQARERETLRADGERAARLEAQRARDDEELARRDTARQAAAASKARAAAERSEADARAFADFLANSVLSAPRPKVIQGGTGPDVTLADALRHAEGQIDRVFKDAPRAEALARNAIGMTWRTLGRYGDAERHLRRALDLWEREAGAESPEAATARNSLAVTLGQSGQADEAERLLVRVADWSAARFGPAHRETLVARLNLAGLWLSRGEVEKARVMLEELLADGRHLLPPDQLLVARGNLAGIHLLRREFSAAETMYRELIPEMEKEVGSDGQRTIECRHNLASALVSQGRLAEAVPVYRKALDDALAALTLGHPLTRRARDNLIRCHERLGERDAAEGIRQKYRDPGPQGPK